MMGGFTDFAAEYRRLAILQTLEADQDYEVNEAMLQKALEYLGLAASRDVIRADIAWLRDQGLASTREIMGLWVPRATQRGVDAARGLATVPGVARKGPED